MQCGAEKKNIKVESWCFVQVRRQCTTERTYLTRGIDRAAGVYTKLGCGVGILEWMSALKC